MSSNENIEQLRKENEKLNRIMEQKIEEEKARKAQIINEITKKKYIPLPDNRIEFVCLDLYLIETLSEIRCPFCDYLKNSDIMQKLKDLYIELKIKESNYKFKIISVDWADRLRKDPPYSFQMTQLGKNYFYAFGLGIDKFPAIDLKVKLITSNNIHSLREQGIGQIVKNDKGESEIKITILNDLINFFQNLIQGQLELKSTFLVGHKKGVILNDPILDKKK